MIVSLGEESHVKSRPAVEPVYTYNYLGARCAYISNTAHRLYKTQLVLCRRMEEWNWLPLFYWILGITVVNSYLLHTSVHSKSISSGKH